MTSPFPIFRKLRSLPEFGSLKDADLLDIVNLATPKAVALKQKLVARLLSKLDVESLRNLLEERKGARRREADDGLSETERRAREKAFNIVWCKLAGSEVQTLGFPPPMQSTELIMSKSVLVELLRFLVDMAVPRLLVKSVPPPKSTRSSLLKSAASSATLIDDSDSQAESPVSAVLPSQRQRAPLAKPTTIQRPPITNIRPTSPKFSASDKLASALSDLSFGPQSPIPTQRLKHHNPPKKPSVTSLEDKIVHLERELEIERKSKDELKRDYDALGSGYEQLLKEATLESYDKRRVLMLKSVVLQLERQVVAMEDTVRLRENLVYDLNDHISSLKQELKPLTLESSGPSKSSSSVMSTISHLNQLQAYIKANTGRLDFENEYENLPGLRFFSDFVRPETKLKAKDISMGTIEHLNLGHVGRLEDQLHSLSKDLVALRTVVKNSIAPRLLPNEAPHVTSTVKTALDNLCRCLNSLLGLSVLIPSAPSPSLASLDCSPLPTYESLVAQLPRLNATQRVEIERLLNSYTKQVKAFKQVKQDETQTLETQLNTYASLHSSSTSQAHHIQALTQSQTDTVKLKCRGILPAVEDLQAQMQDLKRNFGKEKLTHFLKVTEETLDDVVKVLQEL